MPAKIILEDLQKIAEKQNGKCLSEEYIGSKTKLTWMCSEGHTWQALQQDIKQGRWCKKCSGKFLTIENMQMIAEERNGKCLSTKYISYHTKLEWMCAEGHRWEATPGHVKGNKSWCLVCSGSQRLTIESMQQIAKERSGKCLSKKYFNKDTRLKWECYQGHIWEASPGNVKKGTWCPQCSYFYSEELCRTTFQQLFGMNFVKKRPVWLQSPDGFRMELDGYCAELKLAFEYNGVQHYEDIPYFQQKDSLEKISSRDVLKSSLCEENGIHLIIITYKDNLIELPKLIQKKLKEIGINFKNVNFDGPIDFNRVYEHKNKIEEMQKFAENKNGKCISTKYINSKTKLKWMCSKGHTWEAVPSSLKAGSWCPTCAGRNKTIADMNEIAENKNGKCISTKYINSTTKLKWMCSKGHTWEAVPYHVRAGSWCPRCANRK